MDTLWAIVPVVAIAGGITYGIFQMYFRSRTAQAQVRGGDPDLRAQLATSTLNHQELRRTVDALERRISLLESERAV